MIFEPLILTGTQDDIWRIIVEFFIVLFLLLPCIPVYRFILIIRGKEKKKID